MGNHRLGIDTDLALKLRDALNLRVFIETGTYKGGTALWAAEHFERVYTIEGYRPRFEVVTQAHAGQFRNLTFVFGDSRHQLARVLGEVHEPALLWLDAHWCGKGAHDANGDECPLIEELMAVNNHLFMSQHAILIDDARLFENPPPYPHDSKQWPSMDEVSKLLNAAPRTIAVYEDVIYALPTKAVGVLTAHMLS